MVYMDLIANYIPDMFVFDYLHWWFVGIEQNLRMEIDKEFYCKLNSKRVTVNKLTCEVFKIDCKVNIPGFIIAMWNEYKLRNLCSEQNIAIQNKSKEFFERIAFTKTEFEEEE